MLHRIPWHTSTSYPLWDGSASRAIETAALAIPRQPSLMERAGQSVARLAQAIAPFARQAWVLCGPGNNGGDGLVASRHLADSGWQVGVHWLGSADHCSSDTHAAWQAACASSVQWLRPEQIPTLTPEDIVIDALLGLGQQGRQSPHTRPSPLLHLLQQSRACPAHVLAVDLPTGLDADHGSWLEGFAPSTHCAPNSRHTLSLLTLKPGMFTAHGRDACGNIWWNDLGCTEQLAAQPPCAWLNARSPAHQRAHNSHKGSFGDVLVIGGAQGMTGAALLAASAALHHGAGRSLLHLLDRTAPGLHAALPDLMFASVETAQQLLRKTSVVAGCGGGTAMAQWLPAVLAQVPRAVLDADALNALAENPGLQSALKSRAEHGQHTILTPHPLEAARLLQTSTAQVQSARRSAAQTLAQQLNCTIVLKGSGSIIASPGQTPHINPTGNARLAIGGTGDVLAGLIGAHWRHGAPPHQIACQAVWEHGALADQWPTTQPLTASALATALLQP